MPIREAEGGASPARVAFLVPGPGETGASADAAAQVRSERAALGLDATFVGPDDDVPGGFDLAVAVGARAAARLDAVAAPRRALWLSELEDRATSPGSVEARALADTYTLPIPVIVAASWMAEQLATLRPDGAPGVTVVRPGVDKGAFPVAAAVAPNDDEPLRVRVAGTPGAPHEGADEARAAAAAAREPVRVVDEGGADVVLALPRIAGLPVAPLHGFHAGATTVMSAVTGHDEYVVDGVNGLVTSWDDERGTSRLLDLLARDRALLGRLRAEALATARAWPGADEATAALGAALRRIIEEEG
jgi:hypothetical protein